MDSKLATPCVVVWDCELVDSVQDEDEVTVNDELALDMMDTDCRIDVMMLFKGLPLTASDGLEDPDAVAVTTEAGDGDAVTITMDRVGEDDVVKSVEAEEVPSDEETLAMSARLMSCVPGTPALGKELISGCSRRCSLAALSGLPKRLKAWVAERMQRSGRKRAMRGIMMALMLT